MAPLHTRRAPCAPEAERCPPRPAGRGGHADPPAGAHLKAHEVARGRGLGVGLNLDRHEHGGAALLAAVLPYSHRHLELLLLPGPTGVRRTLPDRCPCTHSATGAAARTTPASPLLSPLARAGAVLAQGSVQGGRGTAAAMSRRPRHSSGSSAAPRFRSTRGPPALLPRTRHGAASPLFLCPSRWTGGRWGFRRNLFSNEAEFVVEFVGRFKGHFPW